MPVSFLQKPIAGRLIALQIASAAVLGTLLFSTVASAGIWDWYTSQESQEATPPEPLLNDHRNQTRPSKPADVRRLRKQNFPDDPQFPQYQRYPFPDQPNRLGPNDQTGIDDAKAARNEFLAQPRGGLPIYVTQTEWNDADEARFDQFIAKFGAAIASHKCNTVKSCVQSPEANMYAGEDPDGLIMFADCAEFAYFLRAYFAYHNGLPFGYVTEVKMNMQPYASEPSLTEDPSTKELDTSLYGNYIVSRGGSSLPSAVGQEHDLITYMERMFDHVSTRTYRVGPMTPGYGNSDLYPVHLDRVGIRPGTIVHDTGHVLVIWNVDKRGVIHAIDAHPDGSVQFKNIQPSTLGRSRPDQGLGFYRFRPLRLVNPKHATNGELIGGKIVAATDEELVQLGRWSVDQWFGVGSNIQPGSSVDPNLWRTAFSTVNFFDYLALQLRDQNQLIIADSVPGDMMTSLCDQIQQRESDVNTFVAQGINQMPHPNQIPANIFGEDDPTWGAYSTPGRDGRIRASVGDIVKSAVQQFHLAKSGDKIVQFAGDAKAYVAALRARLAALDKTCAIQYTTSDSRTVRLTFSQVLTRLNKMSFDPYLCPEKAWGASGDELASCRDNDSNNIWYKAELPMRNTVGKTSPSDHDVLVIRSTQPITLDLLQNRRNVDQPLSSAINLGTMTPPLMNLDATFANPKFLDLLNK